MWMTTTMLTISRPMMAPVTIDDTNTIIHVTIIANVFVFIITAAFGGIFKAFILVTP